MDERWTFHSIKRAISGLFWGVLSNALWSAISGGALTAVVVAALAYFRQLDSIWFERGLVALVTCCVVTSLYGLILFLRPFLIHGETNISPERYVGKEPSKRTWRKEIVPLDGYKYVDCDFQDVTLQYEGKTPIQLSHCKFGTFDIKTSNPAIAQMLVFLKAAGLIRPECPFILPPGTNVDFPYEISR